jgi:serine/threonine-protein kinase
MIGATDVFVSYKAEDRARLRPLVAALEAEGLSVWWDTHIGAGSHWREDIEQHLDAAKCVIVAWSKRSVGPEGDFVRDEASRARKRGAYLPIRIDPVDPPLGFGEVQAISLKGWKGDRSDPRFRTIVEVVRRRIAGENVAHVKRESATPGISRRTAVAGAVVAVAGAAGGWLLLRPGSAGARRIAVLPFENLSGDSSQAYFAEGIAEELRSVLSRIGLQVIGRASSEAVKDVDTKVAAARLGVANLVTGSVRRSPEIIRINAQLISGKDGVERWGQTYDRGFGDEIRIQTDIATNVAQSLSIALGTAAKTALALGGTRDSAAQDLFLRAGALYSTDTSEDALRQVITLVDAATARDANYSNAYRLKARALELLATSFPKSPADLVNTLAQAKLAAERAISIAPTLGPAYAELALIEQDRFNYPDALKYMKRALALSPDDPLVLPSAMYITRYLGDPREALLLADRLVVLDPLNALTYTRRADVLIAMRRYADAIQSSRRSLQLAPKRSYPHQLIGDALVLMNRPDEARPEYGKVPDDDVFRLAGEAIIAGRARNLRLVERTVTRMRQLFGDAASYNYTQVFAQAGEKDRAFATLEKAFEVRDPGFTGLKTDPFLDPIRRDPRFSTFIRRANFPKFG